MRKFVLLGLFGGMTVLNILLAIAFRGINSVSDETNLNKTLDFSSEYGVKLEVDYLRDNFEPAHE